MAVFTTLLAIIYFYWQFSNFIGDFPILLAKIQLYWRFSQFYWRTGNFTRFFPVLKKPIHTKGAPIRIGCSFSALFKSLFQFCFLFFEAWFTKQCEHVHFVCLNAWLVEWIHTKQVAAHGAGFFEEIHKVTECVLI